MVAVATNDETSNKIIQELGKSISQKGYFPYIKPNWFYRAIHNFLPNRISNFILKDRSPSFFDISHHCYILLCLLIIMNKSEYNPNLLKLLHKASQFAYKQILNGSLYEKESIAKTPRFCNFGDTTAMFVLLRCMIMSQKNGLKVPIESFELLCAEIKLIIDDNSGNLAPIHPKSDSFGNVLPAMWMDDKYKIYHLIITLENIRNA